eukprot:scaffold8050_cov60-Isochrysis_galbana.AAC.1
MVGGLGGRVHHAAGPAPCSIQGSSMLYSGKLRPVPRPTYGVLKPAQRGLGMKALCDATGVGRPPRNRRRLPTPRFVLAFFGTFSFVFPRTCPPHLLNGSKQGQKTKQTKRRMGRKAHLPGGVDEGPVPFRVQPTRDALQVTIGKVERQAAAEAVDDVPGVGCWGSIVAVVG